MKFEQKLKDSWTWKTYCCSCGWCRAGKTLDTGKGQIKRTTGTVSHPKTSQWRPFWPKMIGLGNTNFTLSVAMTFVGIQGSYIWFDQSGSRFTKSGSRFLQNPCELGATCEKIGPQFPTSYLFSWILVTSEVSLYPWLGEIIRHISCTTKM